jgi:hypothetical protein
MASPTGAGNEFLNLNLGLIHTLSREVQIRLRSFLSTEACHQAMQHVLSTSCIHTTLFKLLPPNKPCSVNSVTHRRSPTNPIAAPSLSFTTSTSSLLSKNKDAHCHRGIPARNGRPIHASTPLGLHTASHNHATTSLRFSILPASNDRRGRFK